MFIAKVRVVITNSYLVRSPVGNKHGSMPRPGYDWVNDSRLDAPRLALVLDSCGPAPDDVSIDNCFSSGIVVQWALR